ncbi:MAG: hypothetical protein ACAH95_05850 [Fimbriimonas sp.]
MTNLNRLAVAALSVATLSLSKVGVAQGNSNFDLTYRLEQNSSSPETELAQWASPAIFSARPQAKGARLSLGQYYATLEGRTLEAKELILSFVPNEKALVWFSKQDYLAKGRSAKSRFRMTADTYGFRYIVDGPDGYGGGSTAIQIEAFRPSSADAVTGGGGATFFATKNVSYSLIHSRGENDYQLGFTTVRGAASGKSDVIELAMGRSMQLKEKLKARLEGHLVGQSLKGNGFNIGMEVRPVLFGALSYNAASWLSVEGDLSVMPMGMPIAGGRMTAFSSFQIYNPGGAVAGLRTKFTALGSLRLLFHARF